LRARASDGEGLGVQCGAVEVFGRRADGAGAKIKDGTDALYSTTVEIDEDAREEYWREILRRPDLKKVISLNSPGKYSK
jgi:hypothetical protein